MEKKDSNYLIFGMVGIMVGYFTYLTLFEDRSNYSKKLNCTHIRHSQSNVKNYHPE